MQQTIITRFFYLSLFLLLTAFTNSTSRASGTTLVKSAKYATANKAATLSSALYEELDLQSTGLSKDVLDAAVKGYEKLSEEGVVNNEQYLTIVDFSQSSRKKRLYVLDIENHKLAINTFVSHGKNSGVDQAEKFSNIPESEQSSLGFYVTKNTYSGKHGLSLKLSGLEDGFNDNAERRAIVVHGANYVNAARVNSAYMGRSQGCPAVPQQQASKIISMIKDGSALFIYHPSGKYLNSSKILNS